MKLKREKIQEKKKNEKDMEKKKKMITCSLVQVCDRTEAQPLHHSNQQESVIKIISK